MSGLRHWLQELGLEKYEDALRAQDVDLELAPELTEQDLAKIGLSLGHRRKFIAAAARPREAPAPDERRQVTVLFSDVVASSALAAELDPEDLRQLLDEYRAACSSAIGHYEGHVAKFLGDGVLAYFGYPSALEDAAERAVRAGLDVVTQVARVKRPDG